MTAGTTEVHADAIEQFRAEWPDRSATLDAKLRERSVVIVDEQRSGSNGNNHKN